MKTLVGMVTFGLFEFTKLSIESIKETTENEIDFCIVVGKPGDVQTLQYCIDNKIHCIVHDQNWGFPCGLNDIYDYAWKTNSYDNLVICGNDIVAYKHTVDSLINFANITDYEVISGLQYDVRDLVQEHPEVQQYFSKDGKMKFNAWGIAKPWELFAGATEEFIVADMRLYDIQNMCLYKKSCFDKIGYTDVNFYPAYFVDNDYARRIVKANIKCCSLVNARFFHWWSRVINQGEGGSNNQYFEANSKYYRFKWGGSFSEETKEPPIKIDSREREKGQIRFWQES